MILARSALTWLVGMMHEFEKSQELRLVPWFHRYRLAAVAMFAVRPLVSPVGCGTSVGRLHEQTCEDTPRYIDFDSCGYHLR